MTGLYIGSVAGERYELPADAITAMTAIIGRRGSGKTYTAKVYAEEFITHGLPVTILDPLGVFWGLRSSADGKSAGLPVTILGGVHGDLPLESTAGKLIADLVVDRPGVYVLDLSGFNSLAEHDRFAADFADRLFRAKTQNQTAMHLIVDEADSFAPQRPQPGQQRMLGAFEAIVRRGRSRGLGATLITQRPAVLNKNVLSQCEVLIAMQVMAPQDRAALKAWAEGNAGKEEVDTFLASLAPLQVGQAWLWSPSWLQVFERIDVRRQTTYDSSATPKAGEVRTQPQVLAPVDLDELRARMAATIERVEQDDPKKLRGEIARLQRELTTTKDSLVVQPCNHEAELDDLRALVGEAENAAGVYEAKWQAAEAKLAGIRALVETVAFDGEPTL